MATMSEANGVRQCAYLRRMLKMLILNQLIKGMIHINPVMLKTGLKTQ